MTVSRSGVDARLLAAIWLRSDLLYGRARGERMALVKALVTKPSEMEKRRRGWREWLGSPSGLVLDASMSAEALFAAVRTGGVRVLFAYPPALLIMTDQIEWGRLRDLDLRYLMSGGEVLYPDQRRRIEEAFGAPVYECYASTELDLISLQCPDAAAAGATLHRLMEDSVLVEVDDQGGGRGELIGTSLHAWAMPFIRYRQGDVVEWAEADDSPMASLRKIQGRVLDMFVAPDDSWVHPYDIFVPMRDRFRKIRRFEATQRTKLDVRLRLELSEPFSPEEFVELQRLFAERFAAEARLEIEVVDGFDDAPGKFKQYRSHVRAQPGQGPEER